MLNEDFIQQENIKVILAIPFISTQHLENTVTMLSVYHTLNQKKTEVNKTARDGLQCVL